MDMNQDLETARDDIAFMRSLAEGPNQHNRTMGEALFAAGLIYGAQTLGQWAVDIELISVSGGMYFAWILGCNLAFFAVLGALIWRERGKKTEGVTRRAYEAAFQAAGLANLSIVLVFLAATLRGVDAGIWYFYTPMVFALQGGAWFVFFRLRKRAWLGLVALGWFASAIGLGLTTHSPTYVLVASISLFALLGLPGWVMMRLAKREAE
jgi:predicted outer membrane lipoprotein